MGTLLNHTIGLDRWTRWKQVAFSLFAGESRREIMISISSLAGVGFIGIGLRFIGGVIQGRLIGPETLGYYTKFTILPGYLFFLHLGVFTSLARQYPYYVGRGEQSTAITYASNALGWTYLLCAIHAVVFLIPSLWAAKRGDWAAALGWGTQIVVTFTSLYMFYLGSTYRNSSEFVAWSKSSLISSIASLLLLPFVALYRFFGICIRYSLPEFLSMLYAHRKRPLRILARFDPNVLRKMIVFGAPLMVFAYMSNHLWSSVERSYILKVTDEKTLGLFAFAGTLCVALTTVATSISQVLQPRIAMLYGSSSRNMAVTFRYCVKCTFLGTFVMLPLVGVTYWLVDPMVRLLLPKYVECIPIVRYICWLSLIPVIDLPKQLLVVAERTRAFGASVITGFALFMTSLGFFFLSGDKITIQKVVFASVTCKLASVIIADGFAWYGARTK